MLRCVGDLRATFLCEEPRRAQWELRALRGLTAGCRFQGDAEQAAIGPRSPEHDPSAGGPSQKDGDTPKRFDTTFTAGYRHPLLPGTELKQKDLLTCALCSKIFVGGLAPETTEADLKDYFTVYGELSDIVVMRGAVLFLKRSTPVAATVHTVRAPIQIVCFVGILCHALVRAKQLACSCPIWGRVCLQAQRAFLLTVWISGCMAGNRQNDRQRTRLWFRDVPGQQRCVPRMPF